MSVQYSELTRSQRDEHNKWTSRWALLNGAANVVFDQIKGALDTAALAADSVRDCVRRLTRMRSELQLEDVHILTEADRAKARKENLNEQTKINKQCDACLQSIAERIGK